jgi:hypothetical protein
MAYQPGAASTQELNPMAPGLQDTTDKRLFGANNRKPRVFADIFKPKVQPSVPLDFAMWMQREFDSIVDLHNNIHDCPLHEFYPVVYKSAKVCRCGLEVYDGVKR